MYKLSLLAAVACLLVVFFQSTNKIDTGAPLLNKKFQDSSKFPLNTLSDYEIFEGNLALQNTDKEFIEYLPASQLFTDYASKRRWFYLPKGQPMKYVSDSVVFDMPIGSIIIKNFYYPNSLPDTLNRIIETRMMYKNEKGWQFANYIWNKEQTDAFLDTLGRTTKISFLDKKILKTIPAYRIPSQKECITCHKVDVGVILLRDIYVWINLP